MEMNKTQKTQKKSNDVKKETKKNFGFDGPMRQVGLSNLNQSVTLLSTSHKDDMMKLCSYALELLHTLKEHDEKNQMRRDL